MMTWTEIDPDTMELTDAAGVLVGSVKRKGGSWECWYYTEEVIAFRPDAESALRCVTDYHAKLMKV